MKPVASAGVLPDVNLHKLAGLRAAIGPEDVERLRVDAERAIAQLAPGSYFWSAASQVLEVAVRLAGSYASSDASTQLKEQSDGEVSEELRFRMRLAADLTVAELRLLPFLATHLSFREIGERLYISRNTVKTQAIAIYRKLGASSRSEAVKHASELGLIEASAATSPGDPGRTAAVTQEQLTLAVVAFCDLGTSLTREAIA